MVKKIIKAIIYYFSLKKNWNMKMNEPVHIEIVEKEQ